MVREVLKASRERNRRMLTHLSQSERKQLMTLMEKVTLGSLELLAELKGVNDEEELQTPEPRTLFETETL